MIFISTKAVAYSFWVSSSKQEIRKTLYHYTTQRRRTAYIRVLVRGGSSCRSLFAIGALRFQVGNESFFNLSLTVGTSLYCGPTIQYSGATHVT